MVEGRAAADGYHGLALAAQRILGLQLSKDQQEAFRWYSRELQAWNERFNLTAITEPEDIEVKHFLDSLTCLKVLESSGRLIDVGTGGGFPGIPIKLLCPRLEVTLLESTRKKVDFCRHVIESLGLEGIEAIHSRAEELGHHPDHRDRYDMAVARAVAPMNVLVEYLLPFLKRGGRMIAMKGETAPAEVQEAESAIELLGGRMKRLLPIELPKVAETRYLIVIEKASATPEEYPRRPGMPSKRPL
ncbi:MAG: 16S rRNA (guanine(527)-N(7))-methyltransferase RsmG [Anaerolineales bacterium]